MPPFDVANDVYIQLKDAFSRLVAEHDLARDEMDVTCSRLTAQQAIGDPQHTDYPIIRGREYMVAASFRGAVGQAFTDTFFGDFRGTVSDVIGLPLNDNHERAVFVAGLNAVLCSVGLIEGTEHCRDDEPVECARRLPEYLSAKHPEARNILVAGFQPRMIEALSRQYDVRVIDLDPDNIGASKFGVLIDGPDMALSHLAWCDLALVTGTTLVNGTMSDYWSEKPVVFYGVTIAGAAHLLGLERFCFCAPSLVDRG